MEAIVAEREANGPFTSLEDLFRRLPPGTMNRRALEGLAGAGAFDAFEPNRAKVFANAEMLLAIADEAERSRTSGQHALFGGEDHAAPTLRLAEVEPWPRPEQMAKERENFGFYFAAHPVEQWRAIASANGARSYAHLVEAGVQNGRQQAVIAAMVEGVSRGKTRKGKDFVRADFSDSSGQFTAACFEESLVEPMLRWAAEGTCVLLTVELDSPSPQEPPRVTVRGARPLAEVTSAARMELVCEVDRPEAIPALAMLLAPKPGAHGSVLLRLQIGAGGEDPLLRLGESFALDGDLADQVAAIEGIAKVELKARSGPARLRLVA
jgi:DNA polymerase-3 subunit alpha